MAESTSLGCLLFNAVCVVMLSDVMCVSVCNLSHDRNDLLLFAASPTTGQITAALPDGGLHCDHWPHFGVHVTLSLKSKAAPSVCICVYVMCVCNGAALDRWFCCCQIFGAARRGEPRPFVVLM